MKIVFRIVLGILVLIGVVAGLSMLSGCNNTPTSTEIERQRQEQLSMQAVQSVGMPAITHFAEKRIFKDLLELRDNSPATYTYIVSMNNEFKLLCNSVGFGLPYATQYTNPSMTQHPYNNIYVTLPQADPNGLYSPASAEGTWVFCIDPKSQKPTPFYVEPRVIVSTFPLK